MTPERQLAAWTPACTLKLGVQRAFEAGEAQVSSAFAFPAKVVLCLSYAVWPIVAMRKAVYNRPQVLIESRRVPLFNALHPR